jgi:hypothetical protein
MKIDVNAFTTRSTKDSSVGEPFLLRTSTPQLCRRDMRERGIRSLRLVTGIARGIGILNDSLVLGIRSMKGNGELV